MEFLQELHIFTEGAPITTPPTTLASAVLNEVLTAMVATGGQWPYDIGRCTSETPNANYYGTKVTDDMQRVGGAWELDGKPSCYQLFDDTQGDNYIITIYPCGQVMVMYAGEVPTCYLADGHQW